MSSSSRDTRDDSAARRWSDTLATGVAEVDRQHRILVDTLAEARTKLTDYGMPEAHFEQLTRDLLAYAIYHFDTEERLMRDHRYAEAAPDEAAAHLAQHRAFSAEVMRRRADARVGSPEAGRALLTFLEGWLVNHIMTTDQRLGAFLEPRLRARQAS